MALDVVGRMDYKGGVIHLLETTMPTNKQIDLTYEQVSAALSYDPETGKIAWKISPAKNVKAGDEAGGFRSTHRLSNGRNVAYKYIRFDNYEMPAARIAWVLHYKEWPIGNVLFIDGDTSNLCLTNLKQSQFPTKVNQATRKRNFVTKQAKHAYGIRRYYGMSAEQYASKLLAQGGVCAICARPETVVLHGTVKPLSVDHDHETGEIRELLCNACNHMLGHAEENSDVLDRAAAYLRKHKGTILKIA